jgi:hypothetical protein
MAREKFDGAAIDPRHLPLAGRLSTRSLKHDGV